jgi:3-oxoadipate CoA-transferase alpha subunit
MKNKEYPTFDAAVADIPSGATIMFSGFAAPGTPQNLIAALLRQGATDLTAIANRPGGGVGIAARAVDVGKLIEQGRIRKMICSFTAPTRASQDLLFDKLYEAGKIDAELVPQGTLAERIRAGGAGIGGFYTPTGYGTVVAEGKETREIDGRTYVLEHPIRGDVALVGAHRADRMGNLVYRKTARNFGPVMATAATSTIVQVREVVETGGLDPEAIVTPSIYVDKVVVA